MSANSALYFGFAQGSQGVPGFLPSAHKAIVVPLGKLWTYLCWKEKEQGVGKQNIVSFSFAGSRKEKHMLSESGHDSLDRSYHLHRVD